MIKICTFIVYLILLVLRYYHLWNLGVYEMSWQYLDESKACHGNGQEEAWLTSESLVLYNQYHKPLNLPLQILLRKKKHHQISQPILDNICTRNPSTFCGHTLKNSNDRFEKIIYNNYKPLEMWGVTRRRNRRKTVVMLDLSSMEIQNKLFVRVKKCHKVDKMVLYRCWRRDI